VIRVDLVTGVQACARPIYDEPRGCAPHVAGAEAVRIRWIGNVWIGPPYTYGFGAGYVWGATSGFVLGFTSGVFFDPWWGPWGWGWGWGWRHVDVHHFWDHRDHHEFNRGFDAYHHWRAGG